MSENQKVELIEDLLDTDDDFGFRVRWRYSDYWADVEVFEYIAQDINNDGSRGPKSFNRKNFVSSPDPVYSIDEAESYLEGYIKWDGCSELDIGCPHLCGPRAYRKHFAILEAIYKRAQELMSHGNDQPWDESSLRRAERTT